MSPDPDTASVSGVSPAPTSRSQSVSSCPVHEPQYTERKGDEGKVRTHTFPFLFLLYSFLLLFLPFFSFLSSLLSPLSALSVLISTFLPPPLLFRSSFILFLSLFLYSLHITLLLHQHAPHPPPSFCPTLFLFVALGNPFQSCCFFIYTDLYLIFLLFQEVPWYTQ